MTIRKWCDTVIYLLHALGIGEYIGGIFVGIGLAVFMKDFRRFRMLDCLPF